MRGMRNKNDENVFFDIWENEVQKGNKGKLK